MANQFSKVVVKRAHLTEKGSKGCADSLEMVMNRKEACQTQGLKIGDWKNPGLWAKIAKSVFLEIMHFFACCNRSI